MIEGVAGEGQLLALVAMWIMSVGQREEGERKKTRPKNGRRVEPETQCHRSSNSQRSIDQ